MVLLRSSTALQSVPWRARAEKLSLGKRPRLPLARDTGRFRACGLGVEHRYGELSGGKSAWPGIPLHGLEAWRGKWIILPRGAVPNCNVVGVSCARYSSIGPAEGERLNPRAGSAKKILQQWLNRTDHRFSLRPFLQYNVDSSVGIVPVDARGEMSAEEKMSSMIWAAATRTYLGPESSFPFPLGIW